MANVFKAKKILSSSGIFSSVVTAPNLVYNTGDQTVSGVKNFTSRPTVNGTGVLLSGEAAQLPDTIVYTTGAQTISGLKVFSNNTDFKQNISVSGFYNFDIINTGEPVEGQMSWHPDYGTVEIGMNNDVINPVGFKSFYRVKAASTIRKGTVVMAAGSVGGSEYILASEAQNIGSSGELIMGVSAEEILANNFGDVVAFGPVRGVNTSAFASGAILYYNPLSTGGFTNTTPESPNAKVLVALNLTQSNNGVVFVRVSAGSELGRTDTNVKFSTLQNNDYIRYNLSSGYWENKQLTTGDVSGINNYYLANNPSGFITSQNVVYTTGDQTISGVKTFIGNHFVSGNTTVTGHFAATSKSFLIDHPIYPEKKLQYGSLESPYHGIRLTDKGKIVSDTVKIDLPDYISYLVHPEGVNIQLTNINHDKILFVKEVNIEKNYFVIGLKRKKTDKKTHEFYWTFTAERKDIPKLETEF
jgi:hypothetical protein